MKKNNFFKYEIKDNNYNGLPLSLIKDFEFNKKKKEENSKREVYDFVKKIESKYALIDVKDLVNNVELGDEYEANTKQKLFVVTGEDFDSTEIYTFNIVGSIFYKKKTFNINSRFGNDFLQYMIASSEGFLELEEAGGVSKDISIAEWLIIYYFKVKLKSAFTLGMYKTYSKLSNDLNKIRGQIDINHYINKGYFDGKTRCTYQQHSYINEVNYIISRAINKIFKDDKYQAIVQDIHTIKNAFNQIEHKNLNLRQLKNIKVKNPFYAQYNEVCKLAHRILNDDFGSSGTEDFSAFLFDISLLFEHHIRSLLKTKYKLYPKNQKDYKVPNGCGCNSIYPDVIIKNEDGTISLYDVKYKYFRGEVDRSDRFQLISYVAIYLNGYEIKECGFIYPGDVQEKCIKKQELNVAGHRIPFKIILYNIFNAKTENTVVDVDNQEKPFFSKYKHGQKELDKIFLDHFNIEST